MKFIRTSDNMKNQNTKAHSEYKQESICDEDFTVLKENISEVNKTIKNCKTREIDLKDKSIKELFIDFYLKNRGRPPKDELTNLFLEIISEEGESKDETY